MASFSSRKGQEEARKKKQPAPRHASAYSLCEISLVVDPWKSILSAGSARQEDQADDTSAGNLFLKTPRIITTYLLCSYLTSQDVAYGIQVLAANEHCGMASDWSFSLALDALLA